MSLAKTYDPHQLEQQLYSEWERENYFAPSGQGEPYCIMIPPPNVTGTLHMGHAFQDAIMDTLIRYHRMQGRNTLWQPGTDHAGIATQMVVERQLAAQGEHRSQLGREEFLRRVWRWKEESGGTITRQLRRMGASPDWTRERFTMDEGLSEAVQEVFVRLHEEGLIYRGKRLVNWDPVLHTAVSDLEVQHNEENGHLWHIRYPLAQSDGYLVVATTRPETMLGDTAVAVHPEDSRYRELIGQQLILPLCDRTIPIIGDEYVDQSFGSGCVKITPAHDFNDYQVGQRHNLALINIFTKDAACNEQVPAAYAGLDRFTARERIVADLQALDLVAKIDPHRHVVPRGDRSNAVIEPWLTDQWFVKAAPLAERAMAAVKQGKIKFVPKNWEKTYFSWLENIQDWCISRQIWWGHRIPAWYDQNGKVYVAHDEAAARSKYSINPKLPLHQDEDVLDTWFSSALWPFSTLGWPTPNEALKTFYPTSVLVTGFDIIFFWVARMIMMGLHFMDEVPFKEVYIHGLVRDADGNKMSKSKGNVLDPLDIIDGISSQALVEKRTTGLMQPQMANKIAAQTRREFPDGIPAYGTDALRFTFATLASTGRDIRFDLKRVEGYRNFCNKIWNATAFVLRNAETQNASLNTQEIKLGLAERWIISRLQRLQQNIAENIQIYRLDLIANALYEFTWSEYCDWYVEVCKPVLTDSSSDPKLQQGTRHTLVHVLETLLRSLHPIMPFISDALWRKLAPLAGKSNNTIMLEPAPSPILEEIDVAAERDFAHIQTVVNAIRQLRSESNIKPGLKLTAIFETAKPEALQRIVANAPTVLHLARLSAIEPLVDEAPKLAATAVTEELRIYLPLEGVIDKNSEIKRLQGRLKVVDKAIAQNMNKLDNPKFVAKAPQQLVAQERMRLDDNNAIRAKLLEQLEKLAH